MNIKYFIGFKKDKYVINKQFETQISNLPNQDYKIEVNREIYRDFLFYHLNIIFNDKQMEYLFLSNLATILKDLIVSDYKVIIIDRMLNSFDIFITNKEREFIKNKVLSSSLNNKKWEKEIQNLITRYLKENRTIILEGFINFRLQEYWQEIQLTVEDAIEDQLLDKEFDEFVKLLRYFIRTTKSKYKKVHVLFYEKDFKFYDEEMNLITLEGFEQNTVYDTIDCEDVLISMLVNIAPTNLVLHNTNIDDFQSIVNIIIRIFGSERVVNCDGCSNCLMLKSKN